MHNVINTLVYRLSNLEGELPPVPPTITKYQDPPAFVVEKSRETRKRVIDALDLKISGSPPDRFQELCHSLYRFKVPPKPKKISKKAQTYNAGAAEDIQYDRLFGSAPLPSAGGFSSVPTGSVSNPLGRAATQLPPPVAEPKVDMDVDVKPSPPAQIGRAHV